MGAVLPRRVGSRMEDGGSTGEGSGEGGGGGGLELMVEFRRGVGRALPSGWPLPAVG